MSNIIQIGKPANHDGGEPVNVSGREPGRMQGRRCSCIFDKRTSTGLVALAIFVAMFVTASILASGIYGGGKFAFIAAGIVVGCIVPLGTAAWFLSPRGDAVRGREQINDDEMGYSSDSQNTEKSTQN
jgi:hypothetical protein